MMPSNADYCLGRRDGDLEGRYPAAEVILKKRGCQTALKMLVTTFLLLECR